MNLELNLDSVFGCEYKLCLSQAFWPCLFKQSQAGRPCDLLPTDTSLFAVCVCVCVLAS